MQAIRARQVDRIVVYKIGRLTRSLADFAKLVEDLGSTGGSFVSVTQSSNTATSMGRLTLNMLLSFAQFERAHAEKMHALGYRVEVATPSNRPPRKTLLPGGAAAA